MIKLTKKYVGCMMVTLTLSMSATTPTIADEGVNNDVVVTKEDIINAPVITDEEWIERNIGSDIIELEDCRLIKYGLPSDYYPGIDQSSFQPFMHFGKITDRSSQAYTISRSVCAYTDNTGLRRYVTPDNKFKIDNNDDYIVALGTYYKPKGVCGTRYLVVTTTGMFTIITGDEKDDKDTDNMHMFSSHCNGRKAGLIEWIVDEPLLNSNIRKCGTVSAGPVEAIQGDIICIYGIE